MFKDIKDVFDKHLHLTYDENLYRKLEAFRINWVQKSDEYIEFFGSNLTGVHNIRFSTRDEDAIFIDILNLNYEDLEYDIFHTVGIDKNKKVSSNPFYLTMTYLMYGFLKSKTIGRYRDDVIREVYYIFAYKALSSLISHYFKYNVDVGTAKAVIERMSNKFLIKKCNSWQEVLLYRSSDVLPPHGLHYKRLLTLTSDDATRVVSDLQGRLRDLIKNIYIVIIDINASNDKIISTTNLEENENGVGIKDSSNRPDTYTRYLDSIIKIPTDFINDDIIHLVLSIHNNINREQLITTLTYISTTDIKNLNIITNTILETTIYNIAGRGIVTEYNRHIYDILKYTKSYFSSSSIKDKNILYAKKQLNIIIKKSLDKSIQWTSNSLVIAVIVYIVCRSFTKK